MLTAPKPGPTLGMSGLVGKELGGELLGADDDPCWWDDELCDLDDERQRTGMAGTGKAVIEPCIAERPGDLEFLHGLIEGPVATTRRADGGGAAQQPDLSFRIALADGKDVEELEWKPDPA